MQKRIIVILVALGILILLTTDLYAKVNSDKLPDADLGGKFVFNFSKGGLVNIDKAKVKPDDMTAAVIDAGDVVYSKDSGGLIFISSGAYRIVDKIDITDVSGETSFGLKSQKKIISSKDFENKAILLQTTANDYAFILPMKMDKRHLEFRWIVWDKKLKRFEASDLEGFANVTAEKASVKAPVVLDKPLKLGVATLTNLREKNPQALDISSGKLVIVKQLHKLRLSSEEYDDFIVNTLQKADILFRSTPMSEKNTFFASLWIPSRSIYFLGKGKLSDFIGKDLTVYNQYHSKSPQISGKRNLQQGHVYLIRTRDKKYAMIRVLEMTSNDILIRWALQPDGTAIFPEIEDLPGEPPKEVIRLNQAELDKQLIKVSKIDHYTWSDRRQLAEIERLVNEGADVNVVGKGQFAGPLIKIAVSSGKLSVVKLLLEKGASLEAGGKEALLSSAGINNYEICKFLIENGVDPQATTKKGRTPLELVLRSFKPKKELAEYLVSHGGEPKKLTTAAMLGDMEIFDGLLAKTQNVNIRDREQKTALYLAAEYGHYDICKSLIDKGADVNAEMIRGKESPVTIAVLKGHKDIAELLVKTGKVDHAILNNALSRALVYRKYDLAKKLLDADENLKVRFKKHKNYNYHINAGEKCKKFMSEQGFDVSGTEKTK